MNHSGKSLFVKKVLLQPKRLVSRFRNVRGSRDDSEESERLVIEEYSAPPSLHHPPSPPQLNARSLTILDLDDVYSSWRYAQMAQDLRSSLPSTCRWLGPEVNLTGEHPIAAGGFTDIYEAIYDGRKVILKSYRLYVSFDVAQVVARFRNEIHACILLHNRDVDVVPLVGVYSTEAHPFGLVYEYMDGQDLRQYVRNGPNVGRLKMLVGVAQCLRSIHDLGIVHGYLQLVNILVDKDGTAWIAGLGNVSTLPHPTTRTVEGRTAKARDIYAFGVMAYEVFTAGMAANRSMVGGPIPSRPDHHEVSDIVWGMIRKCLVASAGMTIGEVIALLEAELSRIPTSDA